MFKVVIPARYGSSRFPGKVLADVAGLPMFVRTYQCATQSKAEEVIVATDDQRVVDIAKQYDIPVCLTQSDHISGTDRIAEVVRQQAWSDETIVVNVQADEPVTPAENIDAVAALLDRMPKASISTLSKPITTESALHDPGLVKVVSSKAGLAMYFSRAPIAWPRDLSFDELPEVPQGHIGLYGYRCNFLQAYADLTPAPMELIECLEQLRALWHGYQIAVCQSPKPHGPGVDTPEDLAYLLANHHFGSSVG